MCRAEKEVNIANSLLQIFLQIHVRMKTTFKIVFFNITVPDLRFSLLTDFTQRHYERQLLESA